MKLTQANVAKIKPEPGKFEVRVFDDDLPGFGVRVLSSGKKSWLIQYRINGRSTTSTLGRLEKMPAGTARDLAKRKLAQAELGIDPGKEKQDDRYKAAETFQKIAERYLRFKEKELKPQSYDQVQTHLTKHWASFNGLSVHAVTRRDVAARLGELAEERGPYAANRARASLSAYYGWMMREGIVDANPVIGTNKQTDEKSRDRVLSDGELVAVWKACRDDDFGNIVRLLILTGQRRDEVGCIAKSEIDLGARKWVIEGKRTKNSLTHEVPLSDPALAIVRQAIKRERIAGHDLIFGETGRGFSGWSKAMAALDKRISEQTKKKVADWRLHDLRRSMATKMADIGVLPHVIESVLNHISGHKAGVAGIYNKSQYAPEKRQALDQWAAHVAALVAGKPASNIVTMKGRS
jgi:integrase